MAYPHKWSPISYKSSAGQRKHIGQNVARCQQHIQKAAVIGFTVSIYNLSNDAA